MELRTFLADQVCQSVGSKPMIFNLREEADRNRLGTLVDANRVLATQDDYLEQLKEYFAVINPTLINESNFDELFQNYVKNLETEAPLWQHGRYAYFPWIFTLVHILEDEAFQKVRTARNKNLVNAAEQDKFYNSTVGIAGLTIGNSAALAIVLQGGAKHIKLADFDRLALTNLNRIRSGVEQLGVTKVEMTARQIYLINPYAEVELFPEGLTEDNIEDFFEGSRKIDVMVDEIDQFHIKYLMREQARRLGVPVVFAVDNGNNGLVDVERYDLDPQQPFFNNRLGEISYEKLANMDKWEICKTITQFVGAETISLRMKESLAEMGKTLIAWPRLGGATLLNGSIVAYCVRRILNDQPLVSGRASVSLDEKLAPDFQALAGASDAFEGWFRERRVKGLKDSTEISPHAFKVPLTQ